MPLQRDIFGSWSDATGGDHLKQGARSIVARWRREAQVHREQQTEPALLAADAFDRCAAAVERVLAGAKGDARRDLEDLASVWQSILRHMPQAQQHAHRACIDSLIAVINDGEMKDG